MHFTLVLMVRVQCKPASSTLKGVPNRDNNNRATADNNWASANRDTPTVACTNRCILVGYIGWDYRRIFLSLDLDGISRKWEALGLAATAKRSSVCLVVAAYLPRKMESG